MITNAFEQSSLASIHGKYKQQTLVELRETNAVKQCKSCKSLGEISPAVRILLHYHNKLDHMSFDKLKDLARAGYLPSRITKAERIV